MRICGGCGGFVRAGACPGCGSGGGTRLAASSAVALLLGLGAIAEGCHNVPMYGAPITDVSLDETADTGDTAGEEGR